LQQRPKKRKKQLCFGVFRVFGSRLSLLGVSALFIMTRGARFLLEQAKKAGHAARYARSYQTTVTKVNTDLRSRIEELVPQERERLKEIKSKYGKVSLGDTTVDMAIGGMRGIKGMLWETSLLDPDEGIRFRGLSIPECQAKLPAAKKGGEPLPEGFLWLLATGEVPTKEQVDAVTADLQSRSKVSDGSIQGMYLM
jgi:citrate synthase